MNRKLIRPKLTEITDRQPEAPRPQAPQTKSARDRRDNQPQGRSSNQSNGTKPSNQQAAKKSPPQDTNAEIFYYKKQIEGHVPMVIVLQDGEKILGTIEWYDRHALKVNRDGAPNIMLLKHNIKYMYKDPEHL